MDSVQDNPLDRPGRKLSELACKFLKVFPKRSPDQIPTKEVHEKAQEILKKKRYKALLRK